MRACAGGTATETDALCAFIRGRDFASLFLSPSRRSAQINWKELSQAAPTGPRWCPQRCAPPEHWYAVARAPPPTLRLFSARRASAIAHLADFFLPCRCSRAQGPSRRTLSPREFRMPPCGAVGRCLRSSVEGLRRPPRTPPWRRRRRWPISSGLWCNATALARLSWPQPRCRRCCPPWSGASLALSSTRCEPPRPSPPARCGRAAVPLDSRSPTSGASGRAPRADGHRPSARRGRSSYDFRFSQDWGPSQLRSLCEVALEAAAAAEDNSYEKLAGAIAERVAASLAAADGAKGGAEERSELARGEGQRVVAREAGQIVARLAVRPPTAPLFRRRRFFRRPSVPAQVCGSAGAKARARAAMGRREAGVGEPSAVVMEKGRVRR